MPEGEGENNGGTTGGEGGSTTTGGNEGGEKPKTFTQEEVNHLVGGRVAEATRKAESDLAKKLGVSADEAAQILKDHNERAEADKTELQKATDKAAALERERDEERSSRERGEWNTSVKDALRDAEPALKRGKLEGAFKLLELEPGAKPEEVAAAVKKLQTDWAELFEGESEGGGGAPNGDPKGTPPKRTSGEDAYERGKKRAEAATASSQYKILTDQK